MSWWVSLGIRYADHNNICVTIIAHLFWNKSTRKYVKNATSQYHSTIYTSTCTDTHTHTHTHTFTNVTQLTRIIAQLSVIIWWT